MGADIKVSYELKKINPTKCQFCYSLTEYDCYELRQGICSLYLSEEKAQEISEKEGKSSNESDVMYCRNLAESLLSNNYFGKEQMFSIIMHPRDCGHYVFTDGQHRTCIAKHLAINSMYITLENYQADYELKCRACYEKETLKGQFRTKLIQIFIKLNLKRMKKYMLSSDFIDEEYMQFKKSNFRIKQ